jgi:acetyl esterase/lipase
MNLSVVLWAIPQAMRTMAKLYPSYAARLRAAGVPCRVEVVEGAFHAFDYLAPTSTISRDFRDSQLDALASAFRPAARPAPG